ncbi:hypothetical protein L1887_27019 [Cichorium endivia]|nr:hypothetical protein L1887_27019 [Cichorium endivia]
MVGPNSNLPPNLNFLSITRDYSEDGILTTNTIRIENEPGMVIPEASGHVQYTVTKDAIGKFISFTSTPLRDDGIKGESRTCMGQERLQPGSPRLLSLQVIGSPIEGTMLHVNKQYWGGEEGDSTSSDGVQSEVADG